jgi:hypothetical protein
MAATGVNTVWTPNGDAMLSPLTDDDLPGRMEDAVAESLAREVFEHDGVDGHARST